MTNQELIDYYADLLILQYIGKDKAYATIQAYATEFIMNQIVFAVRDAYEVDTAVGAQLDVLAKYIGVSRVALTFTGQVVLTDDELRILIKLAIVQNNSGSSLYDIQVLLNKFLPGALAVFDYQNMRMAYFFDSAFGSSTLAEVFVRQGLLPKPMGVQLAALTYTPDLDTFFGCRTYTLASPSASPFNSYSDYQTDRPWLDYSYAVAI